MRLLAWDCFDGASASAMLAALLDVGAQEHALRAALYRLKGLPPFRLDIRHGVRDGVQGTQVTVRIMPPAAGGILKEEEAGWPETSGSFGFEHDNEQALAGVSTGSLAADIDDLESMNYLPTLGQQHEYQGLDYEPPTDPQDIGRGNAYSVQQAMRIVKHAGLSEQALALVEAALDRRAEATAKTGGMVTRAQAERHKFLGAEDVLCAVGCAVGLEQFGAMQTVCGPIRARQVPAEARALLGTIPCEQDARAGTVSAMAAALLSGAAVAPLPMLRDQRTGYGVSQGADGPCSLRVWVGEQTEVFPQVEAALFLLSANFADLTERDWLDLAAQAVALGAQEVWLGAMTNHEGGFAFTVYAQCVQGCTPQVADLLCVGCTPGSVRIQRIERLAPPAVSKANDPGAGRHTIG
ncbi:MAG: DUF111 family protein [Oscillospiraceae bacterium]|nr:DUF111 family protein [Oscillospiraceae bacterium]